MLRLLTCSLLFVIIVLNVECKNLDLVILHNNDMHSRFEETSRNTGTCIHKTDKIVHCYGGFARTAHLIRDFRNRAEKGEIPKVLYLNAGDTYAGTVWYSVHKWKICVDFMNALKPDAMSLGNHEFDNSPAGLAPFVDQANFPIISANLNFTFTPELNRIKKSIVLEIEGTKVGIIGYLTPETVQISSVGAVIFNPEIPALIEESERLNKEGVKIIIALGHSGFVVDQDIAAKVPLVDVVVGGHSNTFLWNNMAPDIEVIQDVYPKVVTQKSGKKVPVVQAYAYTKYLGVLNVTFNDKGELIKFAGQPILVTDEIPQDKDVVDMLEPYRVAVSNLSKEVVGKTRVVMDGNSERCRVEECNFGNFLADVLVQYVAQQTAGQYWTKSPIGLVNGGGIRNTIEPGNITRADILGAIPFDNRIITLDITGEDLLQVLEQGARFDGISSRGEFLQVSGLKYTVDWTKPPMHRISNVQARCGDCWIPRYLDLQPHKTYNIVSISFLTEGGDGHTVLKTKSKNQKTEDLNDVETIIWYLKRYSPVYPEEQGRITTINKPPDHFTSSTPKLSLCGLLGLVVFMSRFFVVYVI